MVETTSEKQWFAMRDLSRRNSNRMAHHELREAGLEVFTPMTEMLLTIRGKKQHARFPLYRTCCLSTRQKRISTHMLPGIPRSNTAMCSAEVPTNPQSSVKTR